MRGFICALGWVTVPGSAFSSARLSPVLLIARSRQISYATEVEGVVGSGGFVSAAGAAQEISAPDCTGGPRGGAKEAEARPHLAAGLSEPAARGCGASPRRAARWPAHFRSALTAGLRSSAQANEYINSKRGHF